MKINDKGFAFTTMLYGVLSLIMIILLLLFGVLKDANNQSYYYSSVIEESLNKCVSLEVALESCYSSLNPFCDTTPYYSCLGIGTGSTNLRLIDLLRTKVTTVGNGVYLDDKDLVYRGLDVNNYISFSGDVWRIIKVEENGSIKIAYTKYTNKLRWNNVANGDWKSSSIQNELSKNFFATLTDNSRIVERNWNVGRIYDVARSFNDLKDEEGRVQFSSVVALPNATDYIRASLDDSCQNDVLNSTSCSSWLSPYTSWLSNSRYLETTGSDEAYYFAGGNKLLSKNVMELESVVPVVYLNSSVRIKSGDGTISNPYVME